MNLAIVPDRLRAAVSAFRNAGSSSLVGIGSAVASTFDYASRMFRVSSERAQIHKDMERMDKSCPLTSFALNTIASRTVGMEDPTLDAFQVTVEADPLFDGEAISADKIKTAQMEINRLTQRLDLRPESWQIARRTPKFGNEFREVVIDWDKLEVADFKLLPEHTMWPNVDKAGNRIPGYQQRLDGNVAGKPIEFTDFEVIHFAFGELDGYLGTPLAGSARKNWKRLNMAEDVTAIARLIRAFVKFVHKVPVRGQSVKDDQEAITAYKDKITKIGVFNQDAKSIENWEAPTDVKSDFFIPDDGSKRGGVDMLDPRNDQLKDMTDVEYFRDVHIAALTVPKRYYPFESATPKLSEGGGSSEDKHFACTLMLLQMILRKGFAALFDRQLLLKGIDPRSVRYIIRMGDINTTDQLRTAQTQLALSKVAQAWLEMYPEMRGKLNVMLREFGRLSDASLSVLSAMEVSDTKPVDPTEKPAIDDRTSLSDPGNSGERMKV